MDSHAIPRVQVPRKVHRSKASLEATCSQCKYAEVSRNLETLEPRRAADNDCFHCPLLWQIFSEWIHTCSVEHQPVKLNKIVRWHLQMSCFAWLTAQQTQVISAIELCIQYDMNMKECYTLTLPLTGESSEPFTLVMFNAERFQETRGTDKMDLGETPDSPENIE